MTAVLTVPAPETVEIAPSETNAPALRLYHKMAIRALALAAVALPMLSPTGPGNSSPVDVTVALSVLAMLLWAGSARIRVHVPYAVPVAIMVIAGGVASLLGPLPSTGLIALVQDLVLLAWCATIVNVCRTPAALRTFMRAWGTSAAIWAGVLIAAVLAGVDFISGVTPREGNRVLFTMNDPNMAAGYFVLGIVIVWATQYPRRRWQRVIAYTAMAIAVVLTGSNGFSIALVAAVFIGSIIGLGRRFGLASSVLAASVVVVTVAAVVTQVNFPVLLNQVSAVSPVLRDYVSREPTSAVGRNQLLHETLSLYESGTPLGYGPGSVKPLLLSTHAPYEFEAHSDFTAALVERGVFGELGLILLIGGIALRAPVLLPRRLSPEFAAVVPRPWALVGGLVACLIAANIYELGHFRHVWALFAVVAALHLWGRAR